MIFAYLNPWQLASKPSFTHASCNTSLRNLPGVVLIITRRAEESITTTCDDMVAWSCGRK